MVACHPPNLGNIKCLVFTLAHMSGRCKDPNIINKQLWGVLILLNLDDYDTAKRPFWLLTMGRWLMVVVKHGS